MIVAYDVLLVALIALASPLLLVAWLAGWLGRPRVSLFERLRPLARMPEGTVWVHAASVGEVEAAAPLISALLERDVPVVATTLTLTGRARLRARLPRLPSRLMPLDLPGLVQLSLARANVRVLVLIETELWPNLIEAAHVRGAQVIIAGARISDRSFPRYRALRAFFAPLLARVYSIGAKSALDRERFVALGAAPERTSVIGDLKLDRPAPPDPTPALIEALGPGPFILGGSTHSGEEEALIAAWRRLRAEGAKDLRLLLVPRHPERAPDVLRTVRRFGASVALRSFDAARADVVVVDTVGELASLYRLAEIVFVGGTLAHVGGHNFVEPVQAGRIALHGPHVENQRAQVELLEPLGVLHPIANAEDLERALVTLWADPERNAPALAAAKQLDAHRGATVRTLERVLEARGTRA